MADRKLRSHISAERAADVLFRSHHTCCVCREPGKAVQIHHLNENPADHRVENLAVLCLEDHNRTQVRGGFSRHLSAHEVRRYREDWYARVERRREEIDQIVVNNIKLNFVQDDQPVSIDDVAYLLRLPTIKRSLFDEARPRWDSGVTSEMNSAAYDVIDGLSAIWVELTDLYPKSHFGDASLFVAEFQARSFSFHRLANEPRGPGSGGTMMGQIVAGAVMEDIDRLVASTVDAIYVAFLDQEFDLPRWTDQWRLAGVPKDD